MKNWKTTLLGVLSAVALAIKPSFPDFGGIIDGLSAMFIGLLGYFAKDNDVTGTGK